MAKHALPSIETLRQRLCYDKKSGKLFRLKRIRGGAEVRVETGLTKHSKGYLQTTVNRRGMLVHRVVFALVNGFWPVEVDHINGVKTDNRWENLRDASHSENCKNLRVTKSNTSGVVGVHWNRSRSSWETRIKVDGKYIRIGYFRNLDVAASARKDAEIMYGFHKNHGATPA